VPSVCLESKRCSDKSDDDGSGAFVDVDEEVIDAAMIGRSEYGLLARVLAEARNPPSPSENRLHDETCRDQHAQFRRAALSD
jgi:hypothetical protein